MKDLLTLERILPTRDLRRFLPSLSKAIDELGIRESPVVEDPKEEPEEVDEPTI